MVLHCEDCLFENIAHNYNFSKFFRSNLSTSIIKEYICTHNEKKNTRFITNSKTRDELYFVFIIHFKWNIINHYHFLKYYYLFFKTQFIALVKTMFYNLFIKILLLTIELFIQKLLFIHFVYILYNWISNFKELKFAWIFQSWSSN